MLPAMTAASSELWRRLSDFRIDDPGNALSFSRRLAAENGWSHEFALDAIREYKRFLFLAATAGHLCTPSDEVDQVWHLHLCYTRSYWNDLCRDLLGSELHHGPTRGGSSETNRFREAYVATLASYERAFGEVPDPLLWPAVADRFDPARRFRRIDLSRSWILPRPSLVISGGLVAGASALFLIACRDLPLARAGFPFSWLEIVIAVIAFLIILSIIKKGGGPGNRGKGRNYRGGAAGSGCGSSGSGCGTDSGCSNDSGCGSSCGSSCGGGGCGGGGD